MAAFGIGMILGGGITVAISRKVPPQLLLAIGLTASAIGFIGMGMSTAFWLTLTAQFFSGVFMPCIHIGINTMILQNTEEAFIGRVNGILNPVFMGAMVITMSASGWVKSHLPITYVYEASAVLLLVGILVLLPLMKKEATANQLKEEI